ncbi:hypothetical protein H0I54_10365 [Yersinia kristensenii]|uniref:LuxR C-terminal-related transcriptional regulator n=1 Tax=Yersinia kristensenii TaxID=28152 RepID=UPI0011A4D69E|nr:LuxR C-terminal-related transcriptional regulator [Yersinia kristensenii]MBW5812529.1 hypothetical protein [Yersinia kristensenii]MBW5817908.1 hypothetical protein [Yersinia kristensenii]MBW5829830.1 hypothetical protein [Yersinia kristensenii]MBW5842224.1 hypothetical protein [Yersinia kristensenii]MDA5490316.1 LuxR C-terminal-related transcriptional regulator [Yersinia kristensenii]
MKNNDNAVKNKLIYLIDTDVFFSLGLRSQLESKGFDVFCSNLRGKELASDIAARKPDILLIGSDKILSDNNELISRIPTVSPSSVMILLSSLVNSESCFSFYRKLGLASCVSKKDQFASLYNVIKVVSTGYACFPYSSSNRNNEIKKAGVSELELTLLKSILQGNDNDNVAKELSVPLKRVSALKIGLMKRLGVNSTAHLVIKAQQLLAA